MINEMPFEGFKELIKNRLEERDPASFNRIKRLFLNNATDRLRPFAYLIKKICGKNHIERNARNHWINIITHKEDMEAKLGRIISIQTAAVDYFSIIGDSHPQSFDKQDIDLQTKTNGQKKPEEWISRIYSPSYFLEKLKEEIQRAQRYNHALSAILLDIDEFHKINEMYSFKTGDEILALIVKIVRNIIRTVDILARYTGDQFLIILPNTNEREGKELAERIRNNIADRTKNIPQIPSGVTVTLSVGQNGKNEKSLEFAKRIESVLRNGKIKAKNAVYVA